MPEERKQIMKPHIGAEASKAVKVDFPGNSKMKKEESPRKVQKIVSGKVTQRKKTLGKKAAEVFFGDNVNSVLDYVFQDVLIPAAKSMFYEMVTGGMEMRLYGERKGNRSNGRSRNGSYISYDKRSYTSYDRRDERRELSHRSRAKHNFDDIILDSRGEAEEVISHLVDLIVDYGQATVEDLYDLVGISANFTDDKYGWTDLRSASVSRARGEGYLLNLPKTVLLD